MPLPQIPDVLSKGHDRGLRHPREVVPSVKVHETLTKFHTEFPASTSLHDDLRDGDEQGQVREPGARPEEGDRRQFRHGHVGLARQDAAGQRRASAARPRSTTATSSTRSRWPRRRRSSGCRARSATSGWPTSSAGSTARNCCGAHADLIAKYTKGLRPRVDLRCYAFFTTSRFRGRSRSGSPCRRGSRPSASPASTPGPGRWCRPRETPGR